MLFFLFLRTVGTIEAEEDVELMKQLRWPSGHLLSVPPTETPGFSGTEQRLFHGCPLLCVCIVHAKLSP